MAAEQLLEQGIQEAGNLGRHELVDDLREVMKELVYLRLLTASLKRTVELADQRIGEEREYARAVITSLVNGHAFRTTHLSHHDMRRAACSKVEVIRDTFGPQKTPMIILKASNK